MRSFKCFAHLPSAISQLLIPMPELPEVEVLVRHLRPLIRGKTIRGVNVRRTKVLAPTSLRNSAEPCWAQNSPDCRVAANICCFSFARKPAVNR